MRKLIAVAFLLLALAPAHAQFNSFPPGVFDNLPARSPAGGGGSYTGPGDIITANAVVWWGLRAYSAADRGNRLVNVCIPSDVTCADLSSDATTGALVITTIGGSSCGVVTCTIKTWYDRSGASACSGACDATQATEAQRSVLILNCVNTTLPCARATSGLNGAASAALGSTVAQPFSASAIGKRTGSTASFSDLMASNGATGTVQVGWSNSANTAFMYAGNVGTKSATDNAWHAFQYMFSGASSIIGVDGSNSTVNALTSSLSSTLHFPGIANKITGGDFVEGGFWSGDKSSNFAALCTNQFTYWGTSTSC